MPDPTVLKKDTTVQGQQGSGNVVPPPSPSKNPEGGVGSRLDFLSSITYAVIVVLFVGFAEMFVVVAGMLINDWNNKAQTYQQLTEQVKNQSLKIDSLINELQQKPISTSTR